MYIYIYYVCMYIYIYIYTHTYECLLHEVHAEGRPGAGEVDSPHGPVRQPYIYLITLYSE